MPAAKANSKTRKSIKPAAVVQLVPAATAKPVPPDAVRVWRGFRLPAMAATNFRNALGSVFIPATAILQRLYGLTAYLPTVLPDSKPPGVPDEIAIVFYETQQAYTDTKKIVAGRAYSNLHSTVFAFPNSVSGFPILLDGHVGLDTPYHLFTESVDWQTGYSQVFCGACDAAVPVETFRLKLETFLFKLQKSPPEGLDAVIVCVSARYVVYWEHWTSEGASLHGSISQLARLADRVVLQPHAPTPVESGIAMQYAGLPDVDSRSFNILFPR